MGHIAINSGQTALQGSLWTSLKRDHEPETRQAIEANAALRSHPNPTFRARQA